jgi:hypothetical protein
MITHSLADMSDHDIANRYGLGPKEAQICKTHCRAIREKGLTGAIESMGGITASPKGWVPVKSSKGSKKGSKGSGKQ